MGKGGKKQDTHPLLVEPAPSPFSLFQIIVFVVATAALAITVSVIYGLIPLQGEWPRPFSFVFELFAFFQLQTLVILS